MATRFFLGDTRRHIELINEDKYLLNNLRDWGNVEVIAPNYWEGRERGGGMSRLIRKVARFSRFVFLGLTCIYGYRRSLQFTVSRGHNILEVKERLFASEKSHD